MPEKQEKKFNPIKKRKIKRILKIIFIICLFFLIIGIISFVRSTVKWKMISSLMFNNSNSVVLDINNEIVDKIGSEQNKEVVGFNDIPIDIINAYVSIEDERFYKHFGVDIKRTIGATFNYIFHRNGSRFGASTITQQLVKNLTGNNETTISRKIKEWKYAIELEWWHNKDEILEMYLNNIYVGPNIYGVKSGAKYYFDKDISELNLVESAFLAGINNSPNNYNPFSEDKDNTEKITKRTKIVLNKMLELGYIDQNRYDEAISIVDKGFEFDKGKFDNDDKKVYSYHTDALLTEVLADMSDEYDISSEFAMNILKTSDLKIYSTQDSDIQSVLEKEYKNKNYILHSSNDSKITSQSAMVIMSPKTGYVVGCVGGLGEKKESRCFNRATQAVRQTGSSSKPIIVVAPALQERLITPVTTYMDEETTFIDNEGKEYTPTDYNGFFGRITVRRSIESSQNIPFVKIMEILTPKTSIKYLKKMGISTLTENDDNLSLALGGLDKGISPLEMAGAYNTIANDGVYIEPCFYIKLENNLGKEILKSSQESRKVFDKNVCYVMKSLLTQPVNGTNGTAQYCKISGIDVAAKTGTTNENYDRWLCGFTNYYTAVTWYGFDMSERINYSGNNPAGVIWSDVIKKIHSKLDDSKFVKPSGVVEKEICNKSGQCATQNCTDTYTEYFVQGTEPEMCVMHK